MDEINKEKCWSVYMHTVPKELSGYDYDKHYIGITKNVIKRWQNGGGYSKQPFHKAIKKYGWNNMKHEVLYTNLTIDEASNLEKQLIEEYNSSDGVHGYNIKTGGMDGFVPGARVKVNIYSKEGKYIDTFESISDLSKYLNIHAANITQNGLQKEHIVKGFQIRYFDQFDNCEDIEPYVENSNKRRVCQFHYKTKEYINTYDTIVDAANSIGVAPSSVRRVCVVKYKKCKDYIFRYIEDVDIINNVPTLKDTDEGYNNPVARAIVQFDLNGNYIKNFCSIIEAEKETGYSHQLIGKCAKGAYNTAYGYIWRYINDVKELNGSFFIA